MGKIKPAMMAAALAACAMWALASMVAIPEPQTAARGASTHINTFELMSVSKGLPAQRYDAF